MKLICLNYAGGNLAVFDGIKKHLSHDVELIALDYAGHGSRMKEDFYDSFQAMVEDMAVVINDNIDEEPYALLGYSMGSVVAYEVVAQKLLKYNPIYMFLASHEAPCEKWDDRLYSDMDDLEFAHYIEAFGGFAKFEDKMLGQKFFMKMIFNPIRADYRLLADYSWKSKDNIDIPVSIYYSDKDVPTSHIKKWQKVFDTPIEFVEMGDNHFFIRDYAKELADMIIQKLI